MKPMTLLIMYRLPQNFLLIEGGTLNGRNGEDLMKMAPYT
jgi:hypothetical protein